MTKTSFAKMNCAVAQTLERVGEWWTMLILRNAFCGMSRFDDFRDHLGIASNILTLRLKKLTAAGILKKQRSANDARSFEYSLTSKGIELYPILIAMTDWGERWASNPKGPRIIMLDKANKQAIARVAVYSSSGNVLQPKDIIARPGSGAGDDIRTLLQKDWRRTATDKPAKGRRHANR